MFIQLRTLSLTALAALVTGCSVSMPFKWVDGLSHQQGIDNGTSNEQVIVAITHGTIDPEKRKSFDEAAFRVLDSLPAQSGLVGYSVRRQLFGKEVWTATVWTDEASIQRFVRAPAHAQAVSQSGSAVQQLRYTRLNIRRAELPISWDRLLQAVQANEHAAGTS
jgi:heme-degrading monooxygenase HmoA